MLNDDSEVLTTEKMREKYGLSYKKSPKIRLDKTNIPPTLWPLIPYAEFWGITDDVMREDLIKHASSGDITNLVNMIEEYDDLLDEWLGGPEADNPAPTKEYIAFSAMRMAADFISA